jgi:hypothetical protein
MPTFERMKITDKNVNKTSKLVQEFFKAVYREEFSLFVNLEVKILPILANPDGLSSEPIQSVGIKLIVKANKAAHIPSIEKIGPIAKEVHAMVLEELLAK